MSPVSHREPAPPAPFASRDLAAALAVIVIWGLNFVATALLAMMLLGERITRPMRIGMTLAGAGLACFAVTALAPGNAAVTAAGLLLNLLAASMWAGSNIVVRYWLWTGLLRRHPASRVAPFSLAIPVVGLVAGFVLLGEEVASWQWAGALLVMSALVFVFRAANPMDRARVRAWRQRNQGAKRSRVR